MCRVWEGGAFDGVEEASVVAEVEVRRSQKTKILGKMNRPHPGRKLHIRHRLESEQPKHECRPRWFLGTRSAVRVGPGRGHPRPGTRDHSKGIHPPDGCLVVRSAGGREERRTLTILVSQYKHQLVSMSPGRRRWWWWWREEGGQVVVVAVAGGGGTGCKWLGVI